MLKLNLKSIEAYKIAIIGALRNGSSTARRVALLLRDELKIVDSLIGYGYNELEAVYIVRSLRA